jgi:hypothetical protein
MRCTRMIPDAILAGAGKAAMPIRVDFNVYVLISNTLMPAFSTISDRTLPVMAGLA